MSKYPKHTSADDFSNVDGVHYANTDYETPLLDLDEQDRAFARVGHHIEDGNYVAVVYESDSIRDEPDETRPDRYSLNEFMEKVGEGRFVEIDSFETPREEINLEYFAKKTLHVARSLEETSASTARRAEQLLLESVGADPSGSIDRFHDDVNEWAHMGGDLDTMIEKFKSRVNDEDQSEPAGLTPDL